MTEIYSGAFFDNLNGFFDEVSPMCEECIILKESALSLAGFLLIGGFNARAQDSPDQVLASLKEKS